MKTLNLDPMININSQLLYQQLIEHGFELLGECPDGIGDPVWRVEYPDDVDESAVQTIISAHNANDLTLVERTRAWVISNAGTAVGKLWRDTTIAEKVSLIVCLLYKVGAIDENGKIKPLADWL